MGQYIKIDGNWKQIVSVYKKVNGIWVKQNKYLFDNNIYLYDPTAIDNDVLLIIAEDSYTGKHFYLVAQLNDRRIYPNWTISSGGTYATVNENGKVTILSAADNSLITVQANYKNLVETADILVSYGNQFTIEGPETMIGTSGNVVALYNNTVVNPTWSITSGSSYATINSAGEITILNDGEITVSATYENYNVTKTITVEYDSSHSSHTTVDPNTGAITNSETETTTDPETGAITETTSSTTTNADGSTSETTSETTTNTDGSSTTTSTTTNSDGSSSTSSSTTVENEDGSSSSSSSTTNYDENGNPTSSSQSTTTVSAADSDGAITTETTSSTTNADGTSSESSSTLIENEDGSSSSSSQTINYDENGDTTGSTTNTTDVNVDGSSQSQTTNYNAEGDPTDQQNVGVDTTGNVSTQDVEFDSNGDPTVVGYEIDTSASQGTGKEFEYNGVNTDYYAFDITYGFELNINFTINYSQQPTGQNDGHNNILTAKRASPSPWYGFQLRRSSGKNFIQLGLQMSTGNNQNITINGVSTGVTNEEEFNLTITYNPLASTNKFVCYNNLSGANVLTKNDTFPDINDLKYIKIAIGYAQDENGDPFRFSKINVKSFSVNRIYPTWDSSKSWDTSSQWVS